MNKYRLPVVLLLTCLIPSLLFSYFTNNTVQTVPAETITFTEEKEERIRVLNQDSVLMMDLDRYILCVLLGEMPADFEKEALMAQAVATRTYTLRKVLKQGKHSDADVCTTAACCQAFVDPADYLKAGGTEDALKKMEQAVMNTTNQVLTYRGKLIEATYFSCSGGRTEDAVAVWGTEVPYLQSVESPGEEAAGGFEQKFNFSNDDFLNKLGLPATTSLSAEHINITYTAGGGVDKMTVSDIPFSGVELRTLLGLPSTSFVLEFSGENVLLTVRGNGHRVGMSQYGADAMAVQGKAYDEILTHYYPGTSIETLSEAQLQSVFDKAGNL